MSLRPSDLPLRVAGGRGERLQPPEKVDGSARDRTSVAFSVHGIDLSSLDSDFGSFSVIPALRTSSLSPPVSPGVGRDGPKTFSSNLRPKPSPTQETKSMSSSTEVKEGGNGFQSRTESMSKIYHLRENPGSTPELNLVGKSRSFLGKQEVSSSLPDSIHYRPAAQPGEDNISLSLSRRKENRPFRNPLARSKSIRRDSSAKSNPEDDRPIEPSPSTAPSSQEWSDSMLLKAKTDKRRGKSADRSARSTSDNSVPMVKEKVQSSFMSGSKQVMSKAKSGGGHLWNRLGKMTKSAGQEKEIPDSEYVIKVINLPLIEQTRITRISPTLDSCRDKTEFWMPSLPWRCIDYLNLNCEHEGLYRVPGSAPEVRRWLRRFDTELDVDLLDETELYDPNTISSMLKSWMRDLPTEIMPKSMQQALSEVLVKDNPNFQRLGEPVPQKLRNALSQLPPFNYYLLFAITCHLSLLLSHKEKNKMDLNNLSICIGPALDIERWLFNYLVGDWRNCWQGCYTEKRFHAIENERVDPKIVEATAFPGPNFDFDYGPDEYARDHSNSSASTRSSGGDTADEDPAVGSATDSQYEDARSSHPAESTEHSRGAKGEHASEDSKGRVDLENSLASLSTSDSRPVTSGAGDTPARPSAHSRSYSELPPSVPALTTGEPFTVPLH